MSALARLMQGCLTDMPRGLTREIVHAPDSPMGALIESLERIAESQANVLIIGESGVGKEGLVRGLHDLAPWSGGPFVPINCGAIPENLLESELFGHVKGAFTGADRPRKGRFESANGGTLFLDEIGEMPLALQVKLLRVLQEREFIPLGSSTPKKVTFRLVAATNRDLDEASEEGSFRQDLLYRLDVVRLQVPPLRERGMDVAPLAEHFLRLYAERNRSNVSGFSEDALTLMAGYDWPGNVRELENLVQGALVLKREGMIEVNDIERRLRFKPGQRESLTQPAGQHTAELPEDGLQLRETLEELEREFIRQALRRSEGNKAQAAGLLGMNRTTLVEKLKRHPVTSS